MIFQEKIWDIKEYDEAKAEQLAKDLNISPLVAGILTERGFGDAKSAKAFIYGSEKPFNDPFLLKDMQKAAERIERAINAREQITIYGDYDVDGITASSLLYLYLKERGGMVNTYIPRRKSEGYGLNDEALKHISESGTNLVVTVDCGISAVFEVIGAPKNIDIIITDHHTVPEQLPPAYAIINPKQKDCAYPFKELSGVGIAFKLCQALEKNSEWDKFIELVALGTVADIVPLLGENREIVRRGLKAMEKTNLLGLLALIDASGCPKKNISSENVSFIIAPRLNAVGRLEHAQLAVELLVTEDKEKAFKIASELNKENSIRQDISRSIQREAEELLAKEKHIDTAIVLGSEGWHAGVIGIVASRLVDKYNLPTILLSISDGVAKGSCRSIPALNIYDALASVGDILTQFGGHSQAAGLTLPEEKITEFTVRFKEYVKNTVMLSDFLPKQKIDCIPNTAITMDVLNQINLLKPFGCSNEEPVFAFKNIRIRNPRAIGRERNHLRFTVYKENTYKCVMWTKAGLLPFLCENNSVNIAFTLRINDWNGEMQLYAEDICFQGIVIGDFRRFRKKNEILQNMIRSTERMTVYVNDIDGYKGPKEADIVLYGSAPVNKTVVLYDLPKTHLRTIFRQFKDVKTAILLYNVADKAEAMKSLEQSYPDRLMMIAAYKKLMETLQGGSINTEDLDSSIISKNALLVMEELGFISCDGNVITIGNIRKCNLEDSPIYCRLQKERKELATCYTENMSIREELFLR